MAKEVVKSVDQTQDAIEKCLLEGDLSKLSLDQRLSYYKQVCETVGLNPLTKPFQYIVLNGKLTMYALKGATDQLRKIYNINCKITKTEYMEDIYIVIVEVKDNKGRIDEDMGFAKVSGLKGDMLGNAMLKAVTKAKRRATLSMCGLGMLDEDELDSIPDDKGSGKGKKVFDAPELKGTEKLEATLTESEPTDEEKEKIMEEESIDQKDWHKTMESEEWLNEIRTKLSRIFASNGLEFEDESENILKILSSVIDDVKEGVFDLSANFEDLREWAKNHLNNRADLRKYANDEKENWRETLTKGDCDKLYGYMEFLAAQFEEGTVDERYAKEEVE